MDVLVIPPALQPPTHNCNSNLKPIKLNSLLFIIGNKIAHSEWRSSVLQFTPMCGGGLLTVRLAMEVGSVQVATQHLMSDLLFREITYSINRPFWWH